MRSFLNAVYISNTYRTEMACKFVLVHDYLPFKVALPANRQLTQKFREATCSAEFRPIFFRATRNFAEISYGPSATLIHPA